MTITIHHLEHSQSFRLIWLMELLDADYDLKTYPRDRSSNMAPAEYKALSPLGTAPVMTDGDFVMGESNAAIDYILDQYPDSDLRPGPNDADRARYLFWFHAAQGSMMPVLFMNTILSIMPSRAPVFVRSMLKIALDSVINMIVKPRMKALLDQAEAHLAEYDWLAGDRLTAADITMCYPMASAKRAGFMTRAHKGCQRWLEQMEADEAFQRAKAKDEGRDMLFNFR